MAVERLRGRVPHHPPTPASSDSALRYMMVFGWTPFITMCAGQFNLGDDASGALAPSAKFVLDPSPFWAPPVPNQSKLGEMSGLVVAADSSLWGLYRWGIMGREAHRGDPYRGKRPSKMALQLVSVLYMCLFWLSAVSTTIFRTHNSSVSHNLSSHPTPLRGERITPTTNPFPPLFPLPSEASVSGTAPPLTPPTA